MSKFATLWFKISKLGSGWKCEGNKIRVSLQSENSRIIKIRGNSQIYWTKFHIKSKGQPSVFFQFRYFIEFLPLSSWLFLKQQEFVAFQNRRLRRNAVRIAMIFILGTNVRFTRPNLKWAIWLVYSGEKSASGSRVWPIRALVTNQYNDSMAAAWSLWNVNLRNEWANLGGIFLPRDS